ncbi:hypothetical protein Ga0466249_005225 [Sporomusaceae bacterium BoRhaA]|uniref:type II restriction endonuclease n=1 Tax=Pelorhabdus rhamnosifermentans TaxID=2772457 RepID=UPI001C0645DE|nr:type II restriction endonuclease [Pelorhabdus rhamnosifermentans]MBU2704073.1 hypothetical protein [Pelorhabdus rhamnosifermentans]
MNELVQHAIDDCHQNGQSYVKFITANETGTNGSHQTGYYIAKASWSFLFERQGQRGENMERFVTIQWQDDLETDSRFIWYGTGTRREYRITRFGRGFPFLNDDHVGALLVLTKVSDEYYHGWVFNRDEEIDAFMAAFNLSPEDLNTIINAQRQLQPSDIMQEYIESLNQMGIDFPDTVTMSREARSISSLCQRDQTGVDDRLLTWVNTEYELFRAIEQARYQPVISRLFPDVETLIIFANKILNRRKSRAGRSLEHHLRAIFDDEQLRHGWQAVTEGNKKPDFIFPGEAEYHNPRWPQEKLVFLGAKTTCKDRWRQVINEADRIPVKHLFTLQQGISPAQLAEMSIENVKLVVPASNMSSFPREYHENILSLQQFVDMAKHTIA